MAAASARCAASAVERSPIWRLTGGEPPGEERPLKERCAGARRRRRASGLRRLDRALRRCGDALSRALPRPECVPRLQRLRPSRARQGMVGPGDNGARAGNERRCHQPARPAPSMQRHAADPAASVWVAASAGTGKTTVLTDRVLRLLLAGTPPERILCLTFTKAAAAEMANRIARELGEWATIADPLLAKSVDRARRRDARGRHAGARAAAVRPGARYARAACGSRPSMPSASRCCAASRSRPASRRISRCWTSAAPPSSWSARATRSSSRRSRRRDAALAAALAEVTSHVSEEDFRALMAELANERGRARARARQGGLARGGHEGTLPPAWPGSGREPGRGAAKRRRRMRAWHFQRFMRQRPHLPKAPPRTASAGPRSRPGSLLRLRSAPRHFAAYASQFLTKDGAPRSTLATKGVREASPEAEPTLRAEATRLAAVVERLKAAIRRRPVRAAPPGCGGARGL